jgi:hypothetical protein
MRKLELEVFADEIVIPRDYLNQKKNFIALGVLFVPTKDRNNFIKDLSNNRCLFEKSKKWVWLHNNCPFSDECKSSWHDSNNSEIHHQKIRKARTPRALMEVSKNWLKFLVQNNKSGTYPIYFNLLYIDLDKLEIDNFGQDKIHENIYNKFFRTVLSYGIKAYFPNEKVVIKNVYHDKGSMEFHSYFPHLNLQKLTETLDDGTGVLNQEICFVDSDHRKYLNSEEKLHEESNFIQLIDLILGSFTQNIYFLSDDCLKKELAMIIRPLVSRLIKNPNNKNSSYHYCGNQKISFYPKFLLPESKEKVRNLKGNLIEEHKRGQFHTDMNLEMPAYDKEQNSLLQFV